MATWVDPVVSETDPDAPLTSDLAKRWDNNVIALAEGASGAPRIKDAALSTSVTNDGINWVAARVISMASDGIGQTVLARVSSPGPSPGVSWYPGDIVAGSQLRPSDADGLFIDFVSAALPGSWRCQGHSESLGVTTWVRVS